MQDSHERLKAVAEDALRKARRALDRELADYPGPVSGCDAQYTHLLAERRRLSGALDRLRAEVFIPTPRTLTPSSGVERR
jgi:hypothetical protein